MWKVTYCYETHKSTILRYCMYLLQYVISRVHNIYSEGEYPTLHYPVKRHWVKSYTISSRRLRRYKGLLIGVKWHWYIKRQVSAYASAVCNNRLYDKHWLAFQCINTIQHLSTGLYSDDALCCICVTSNAVSFDRVIQCWILSFPIYIMNS